MNSCERDALAVDPARDQHDLLVLDVHALDRADPLGELEHLGLGERRRRVEAAPPLPHKRRVQTLLDRRPDRERRREVIALDDEVGAVAHAGFLDLREQLVGGVASEDVRQARLDADPDERELLRLLPCLIARELVLPEHRPRQLIRAFRMRMGERHRHVQVGDPRPQCGVEDRLVEARVTGVKHGVRPHAIDQLDQLHLARGVDALGAEAIGLTQPLHHRPRTLERDVGQHDVRERRTPLRDRRKRRPNASRPHHQDSHCTSVTQIHIPERPKKMPAILRRGHIPDRA
jgi:hypothetical protein